MNANEAETQPIIANVSDSVAPAANQVVAFGAQAPALGDETAKSIPGTKNDDVSATFKFEGKLQ